MTNEPTLIEIPIDEIEASLCMECDEGFSNADIENNNFNAEFLGFEEDEDGITGFAWEFRHNHCPKNCH